MTEDITASRSSEVKKLSPSFAPFALDQILREPEVKKISGLSRWTRQRMIARGEFPASVKLSQSGNAHGWLASEIQAWLSALALARQP